MRILAGIMILLVWVGCAWAQRWEQGVVTKKPWVDQGGFHVEINAHPFLFLKDAKIQIDGKDHEVPDRFMRITKNARVSFVRSGFTVVVLKVEGGR